MAEFFETDEPVDYVVAAFDRGTKGQTVNLDLTQSYRDTAAENETLRQEIEELKAERDHLVDHGITEDYVHGLRDELAEAHQRIANLSAQCHRNTEQLGRLQRENAGLDAERKAMREVVETAKAVRELWRYDAMAAAEPEIHAFVAAVDALAATDGV